MCTFFLVFTRRFPIVQKYFLLYCSQKEPAVPDIVDNMFDSAFDCVILDGLVVTAADVGRYDIAIKDGKIALLAPARSLGTVKASRVIDAQGGYVMVRDSLIRLASRKVLFTHTRLARWCRRPCALIRTSALWQRQASRRL